MKATKFLFISIVSFISLFALSQNIFAHHTTDGKYEYQECYDTPIPGGASKPDMAQIKKDVLDPIGVPSSIKVNGVTQQINVQFLYKRHVVVYGAPFGDVDNTRSICGLQTRRYAGYTQAGIPLHELDFRVDAGGSSDYIQDRTLVRFPWKNAKLVATSKSVAKFPVASKDTLYATNAERIADLDKIIDSFAPTKNNTHGYFLEKNDHWCENASGALYFSSNCGTKGALLTGKHLQDFAIILQKSTDFTPGVVALYIDNPTCSNNGFCYSIHVIPQDKDPFVIENDAKVSLNLNSTSYVNKNVTGKITVKNDWSVKEPQSIAAPCDTAKNAQKAQCKTSTKNGSITVTSKADSKVVFNKTLSFSELAQGKSTDIDLTQYNIVPPYSGSYEIAVSIPHYVDNSGQSEVTYSNNIAKKTFNYVLDQNASVVVDGESAYSVGQKLNNDIIVSNNTSKPLSGPLTIKIIDKDGKTTKTVSKSFVNIPVNGTYKHNLGKDGITPHAGDYTIEAKIKNYTELPESNYQDNISELGIKVNPYIPENTKCDKLNTQYTKVIPYPGTDPGITKTCIGWTPNFPSTHIEGGQGTYFYVAYKMFPSPMPAYKVTTLDPMGVNQVFEHAEPRNTLGACDLKLENDTDCKLYEPFFYYPVKWESRFATTEYKDFVGPYTVGPHDFHHYRYRGRMMPSSVTFHFSIIDMKNNANIPMANGSVAFDVPETCYEVDTIDITPECRLIQFYVPTDSTIDRKLPLGDASLKIPKDKIEFLNPGEHRFTLEIEEKQKYFYQSDEGAEWQGKDGFTRNPWKVEAPASPNEKWAEVHKYAEGTFESFEFDRETAIGDGNWCLPSGCISKEESGMPMTMPYSKDGYTGTLKEIDYPEFHYDIANPGRFKYYKPREMLLNEDETFGYDYYQRGIYRQSDGTAKFTEWKNYNQRPGSKFIFWTNIPDGTYKGFEWQRYQIMGGVVKKAGTTGGTASGNDVSNYPSNAVKTHTVKGSKPVEWVIQDDYKNQCYSETDAFGNTGSWRNDDFVEKDDKSIVCHHNHSAEYHYWKYDWSNVKKFGNDGYIN